MEGELWKMARGRCDGLGARAGGTAHWPSVRWPFLTCSLAPESSPGRHSPRLIREIHFTNTWWTQHLGSTNSHSCGKCSSSLLVPETPRDTRVAGEGGPAKPALSQHVAWLGKLFCSPLPYRETAGWLEDASHNKCSVHTSSSSWPKTVLPNQERPVAWTGEPPCFEEWGKEVCSHHCYSP